MLKKVTNERSDGIQQQVEYTPVQVEFEKTASNPTRVSDTPMAEESATDEEILTENRISSQNQLVVDGQDERFAN